MTKKIPTDQLKRSRNMSAEKKEMVIKMKESGLAWKEISHISNTKVSTLRCFYTRYNQTKDLPEVRRNRSSKISPFVGRKILLLLRKNPDIPLRSIPGTLRLQYRNIGVLPSFSTIRRYILLKGYRAVTPVNKPLISATNMQKRLDFCRKFLWNGEFEFQDLLFTDETMVRQFGTKARFNWWNPALVLDKPIAPKVHGGGLRQMFWGCMSIHGYGPITPVGESLNGKSYCDLLRNTIVPYISKIFRETGRMLILVQDNAPCHRSKEVLDLIKVLGIRTFKWPASSPDLNPIENAWALLKRRRQSIFGFPKSLSELVEQTIYTWNQMAKSEAINLCSSFEDRLELVIQKRGRPTKY